MFKNVKKNVLNMKNPLKTLKTNPCLQTRKKPFKTLKIL